ncbi:hypothetical protein HanIR_Chr15g0779291 [Helianthus annuus]|nr:hypothetical protein HanIR_Chr15g0779291 [Helianthus annuus]
MLILSWKKIYFLSIIRVRLNVLMKLCLTLQKMQSNLLLLCSNLQNCVCLIIKSNLGLKNEIENI